MKYKINSSGAIIMADLDFVDAHYPGDFTVVVEDTQPFNPRIAEIFSRLSEIDERTTKPRTQREMLLGNVKTIAWVTTLDAEAATLRGELFKLG